MASLDVSGVTAVGFPVDTTITPPVGNDYVLSAGVWIGIPAKQGGVMIVDPPGDAMCMLRGSYNKKGSGEFIQVMAIDEVRSSS